MSNRALSHRRQHNLILIQKLLSLRDASSPFTLLLDSVEQSAKPLLRLYIQNANASKTDVVFVSYETLKPPEGVEAFVNARRKDPEKVRTEIHSVVAKERRTLLIIDSLYPLATQPPPHSLPSFLSSLLSSSPAISLLAIYHTDIPLPAPSFSSPSSNISTTTATTTTIYTPSPFSLLRYLATTILTTHSFGQSLARKRAKDKCREEPRFGIEEEREGVIVGRGANGDGRGMVLEMEYRRKSGRGVEEWFFLPSERGGGRIRGEGIGLLVDEEGWRRDEEGEGEGVGVGAGVGVEEATFELGLTEKQRGERERVVLPYFDAQKGKGGGGGRILYDLGVEDDFDEEEDEI